MPNLQQPLSDLRPRFHQGRYVFVTTPGPVPDAPWVALVQEDEGLTAVIGQQDADRLGFGYDFVAGMITLEANTSLALVGLTARVATVLARAGISCNVVAGRCHDHLFVPFDRAEQAVALLGQLGGLGGLGGA